MYDTPTIWRWWGNKSPSNSHLWTASIITSLHPSCYLEDIYEESSGDLRHQSNLFRLKALYEHGGLWLDHDVIPLTNLIKISPYPWTASLYGRREGAVMWFPKPGHPWLKHLLRVIERQPFNLTSPFRSGERILNLVEKDSKDVGREPRVFPFDALGRPVKGIDQPIAIHLWASSSLNHRKGEP